MSSDVPARLRAAGLRATPARARVLASIEAAPHPLPTPALVAAHPDLDPITLYRTVERLAEAGLVHRVQGLDGAWRACAQPAAQPGCPGNHPHFWCTACATLTCLTDQALPRVVVPAGAQVEARHFLVVGRCPSCAALPSPAQAAP